MADIAATDLTVTLIKTRLLRGSPGGVKHITCKIQFGNDVLNYPALGIPLPSAARFGLIKELDYFLTLDSGSGVATRWTYDFANKKLRGWVDDAVTGVSAEVSGAPAAQTLYGLAVGW